MKIAKLTVKNFGRFENGGIEISNGITKISGSNGTGKSTLLSAVTNVIAGVTVSGSPLNEKNMGDVSCATSSSLQIDGVNYESGITAKTVGGKVTSISGFRSVDGVAKQVREFEVDRPWRMDSLDFMLPDRAISNKNVLSYVLDFARVEKIGDFLAKQPFAEPLRAVLKASFYDVDKTLASLRKTAQEAKNKADAIPDAVQRLKGSMSEPLVVPQDNWSLRIGELTLKRNQLFTILTESKKRSEIAKQDAEQVNAKVASMLKEAANLRKQAADLQRVHDREEQDRVAKQVSRKNQHARDVMNTENEIRDLERSISHFQEYIERDREIIADVNAALQGLLDKLNNGVEGKCPFSGVFCPTAEEYGRDSLLAECRKQATFYKEKKVNAEREIAQLEEKIGQLEVAISELKPKLAKLQEEQIEDAYYKQTIPAEVAELLKRADDITAAAAEVKPVTIDNREENAICEDLKRLDLEIDNLKNERRTIEEAKRYNEGIEVANAQILKQIEGARDEVKKLRIIETEYSTYIDDLRAAVKQYCKSAEEAVSALFSGSEHYLDGLRIKLFQEQKNSELGRMVFTPQLVKGDKVSERLSDGETILFGVALIVNVLQPHAGVDYPVIVDRGESVDMDRLKRALRGKQAIVAVREDHPLQVDTL